VVEYKLKGSQGRKEMVFDKGADSTLGEAARSKPGF